MLNSARKFVVFLLVILFLLPLTAYFFPTRAHAQLQTVSNPTMQTTNSPLNIPVLTQQVLMGFLSSTTCVVGGIDFLSQNHGCLSYNSKTGTFGYAQTTGQGLLGLAAGGVALTFTPPFHTSDYLSYLSNSWIVKKVDAANANTGIGFDQLSPITNLWLAFRNLAYLLFVIVFVVIGFAIMLRAKIDPRTVMTIENQIPKLIIALILITFSFAIAGFVLDIMWVGVYLVINIFASLDPVLSHQIASITAGIRDNPFAFVNNLNSGPLGFLGIAQQAAGGVKDTATAILNNLLDNAPIVKVVLTTIFAVPLLLTCAITSFVPGFVGAGASNVAHGGPLGFLPPIAILNFITGAVSGGSNSNGLTNFGQCLDTGAVGVISLIISAVVFLIFAIALLVAIIRVWWTLIKSYSLFLLFAIFGPIVIMSGVLPGSKTNFEYWIRHLLAYTIVFPTVMGVFLLGKTLMDVYIAHGAATPPLWGTTGQTLAFLGPIIGFAVMMLAPQSLTMVQDALNAPDPKYLAGVGQALGPGIQSIGGGFSKLGERAFRAADPLHNLDEGFLRKRLLPQGSWIRSLVIGRETNLGKLSEQNKGANGH